MISFIHGFLSSNKTLFDFISNWALNSGHLQNKL